MNFFLFCVSNFILLSSYNILLYIFLDMLFSKKLQSVLPSNNLFIKDYNTSEFDAKNHVVTNNGPATTTNNPTTSSSSSSLDKDFVDAKKNNNNNEIMMRQRLNESRSSIEHLNLDDKLSTTSNKSHMTSSNNTNNSSVGYQINHFEFRNKNMMRRHDNHHHNQHQNSNRSHRTRSDKVENNGKELLKAAAAANSKFMVPQTRKKISSDTMAMTSSEKLDRPFPVSNGSKSEFIGNYKVNKLFFLSFKLISTISRRRRKQGYKKSRYILCN